jgi:hypothetical protein
MHGSGNEKEWGSDDDLSLRSWANRTDPGQLGRVLERKAAARGSASLDKYIVLLSSGDCKEFWSVQLEKNSEPGM